MAQTVASPTIIAVNFIVMSCVLGVSKRANEVSKMCDTDTAIFLEGHCSLYAFDRRQQRLDQPAQNTYKQHDVVVGFEAANELWGLPTSNSRQLKPSAAIT